MKIGIMTFWWDPDNYGQILQCYALQKYLEQQGHDPFLIRYMPTKSSPNWSTIFGQNSIRGFFGSCLGILRQKRNSTLAERFNRKNKRNFDIFLEQNVNVSSLIYTNYTQLRASVPEADAFIVGSDQVWNVRAFDNEVRPWFLDFVPKNTKKIAYSASFGRSDLKKEEINEIVPLLENIDFVSVRESEGLELCKKSRRFDCDHTLDPTLLLDKNDYLSMLGLDVDVEKKPDNQVFCYILMGKCVPWRDIKNWAESRRLNILPIPAHGSNMDMPFNKFQTPTIEGWVQSLNASKFSIVTSFHGMVFSIIFEKQFIVCMPEQWERSSRITSLLERLNLMDRIYSPNKGSFERQMNKQINWTSVRGRIRKDIDYSQEFLVKALA